MAVQVEFGPGTVVQTPYQNWTYSLTMNGHEFLWRPIKQYDSEEEAKEAMRQEVLVLNETTKENCDGFV